MARQVVVELIGDNKKFTKSFDDATKSSDSFGAKFGNTAKAVAAGTAIMVGALVAVGAKVFDMGAQYESMDAKAKTVFGDSLGIVQMWAAANASAMGLTSREAIGLAASMGDLLIPMGFSRDAAAEMATTTIGLSGALAEWSNGTKTASEVSDILTKAMLGERDGLKALGISISEADVKQELMRVGSDKLTGAALDQAKALATQTLIMNKSKDAQDAYAKGGDKGARSQAQFNATINTVKETLVTALYPILKTVAKWLAENLPGAIAAAQRGFERIKPVLDIIISVLGVVITVIGKVVDFAVKSVTNIVKAFTDLVNFFQKMPGKIGGAVSGMWNGIWSGFKSVINSIIRGWNSLKFTVPSIDLGPLGKVGGFTLGTPDIPYLHSGGIVPGPTGMDVPAILQAGERVIPISGAGRGGDVHIHIGTFVGDSRTVGMLADLIAQRMRLEGAF